MKRIAILISMIIVIVILIFTVYFVTRPEFIIVQGVANSTEIKISSRVPGRVENIFFKEGERVKTGDIVVTLDAPDLRAKAVQAEAAHRAANAQYVKAEKGARDEEIEATLNIWQKAIVGERVARQTNDRVRQLFEEGVVSAQQRDEAQAKYDASVKDTLAAKAQFDMATQGARVEDKDAAGAMADQASGALMEIESYLSDTVLSSPIDGEISVIVLNKGELAGSGTPLVTITDISDIYFVFNIREDLMPNFTMGTILNVAIPALGEGRHEVKINYIAPRGDFATWSATKTTGQFDMRTFEIRAMPLNEIENLRPGMSAIYYLPIK